MRATQWRPLWPFLFLLCWVQCQRVEWDASNFPNPTAGDFKRCNMMTTASICDPDEVLTKEQRYRLNHELHQLESRTRQDHAPDFCQKKGITAAMAIANHVRGGSEQAVKDMANQMLKKWTLDNQCQKSVVIVVAVGDKRFWVARDPRVPVYAAEFNQIFGGQRPLFEQGDYSKALGNILQQTWEKALSKQGPRTGGDIGGGGTRGGYDRGSGGAGRGSSSGGGQPDFKMPSLPKIPIWVWLAIICGLIPLLCCCCLCYCCFCRKSGRNASPRRQQPSDIETGGGMGGRTREGGGRGGLNSFLGGLGGAGVGSLAGRLLSGGGGGMFGRGRRDMGVSGGGMMDQGGGAYPAGPYHPPPKNEDPGGLYPNVPVADEGGGGSWGSK
ncbi:unnamed protein product [Toxocara canis]|uniref:TPM_phosphatase domain-containing protein n=1 Tax=Toxocara canis TaxID=6265 RepID=A0A183VD97_TOXCA|nr:unnamed protein product [Toxocara canis]